MTEGLFDEQAVRYEAAYAAFQRAYELKQPPPTRTTAVRPDYVVLIALLALVVASVVVSGSRTITEFGGGIVGLMAFVMLEAGIVGYSFIRTKSHFTEERAASVRRLTTAGMLIALAVAVAANLHATLAANGVALAEWLNTAILIAVSVSAPVLAFISGDVLGMEAVAYERRKADAEAVYAAAMGEWRSGLNASWQASPLYRGVRLTTEVTVTTPALSSPVQSASKSLSSGQNPRQRVQSFLQQTPEAVNWTARELAEACAVSPQTANTVRNAMRGVSPIGDKS